MFFLLLLLALFFFIGLFFAIPLLLNRPRREPPEVLDLDAFPREKSPIEAVRDDGAEDFV